MDYQAITKPASVWKQLTAFALGAAAVMAAPISAQNVGTFDPNEAFGTAQSTATESAAQDVGGIDADLAGPQIGAAPTVAPPIDGALPAPDGAVVIADAAPSAPSGFDEEFATYGDNAAPDAAATGDEIVTEASGDAQTYAKDDLIGAAEGVFGKGAEGLARMIEDLLKDQGEPNGYIVGREAGGAFIVGARYGSGTLFHKVEGERKVYWTGPSIGLDAGANAAKTFVLVYNLFDTEDIYTRYPAGEGQAYLIGGMHASYMRKGDVVLIPIRLGAGVRLGINAGYMKFSKKQRWLPF